jgi:hypothetical protein
MHFLKIVICPVLNRGDSSWDPLQSVEVRSSRISVSFILRKSYLLGIRAEVAERVDYSSPKLLRNIWSQLKCESTFSFN